MAGCFSCGGKKAKEEQEKVMTSCVPQVNHEVKHEPVNKYQYSQREPSASGSTTPGTNMSTLRDMINRAQDQIDDDQLVLDLVYITERIISMSFPSDEHEVTYSYNLKEVMNMLRTKHDNNCLVINLSEPRQDLEKLNPKHVIDYGWPDYLAPPLERLCNICKAMDSWLSTDPRHVVVVHCKGSTSRIAVIIAAFMHYCSICASADQALDRFAMKRFYDDKLGGITLPSQVRYVDYFYGLLSGAIKINSNPLYLHHIVIHGVPNFDTSGGCRPFIKVYQGMQNIFTSGVYNVTDQMQKVCISISPGIPLRGDIMIKCYHKKAKTGQREVVWACQFHTCAISGYTLTFAKKDLDDARTDPRFPDAGKVEFVFGNSQDSNVRVTDFKSDVTVPVDDGSDALVRWDSYENFANVKNADIAVNGIAGNTSTNMNTTSTSVNITPQYTPNVNNNDSLHQSYSSTLNSSKSSYSTSAPKKSVPPLDEQTQLDMILSDLLNDSVFVSSPQSPPKTGASNASKETRTFRTYDTQSTPDGKTMYQTAEVTYKIPGGYKEERNYSMTKTEEKSYVPKNAFSYTSGPTSPELQRKAESPKTHTLPYRTDYDNRYYSTNETSFNRTMDSSRSMSPNEQTSSWLQEQQHKLRQRKDSKDEKTVQQERQLVEELKTAQNKYFMKRAHNQAEEQATMDSYQSTSSPPPVANGPVSSSYVMTQNHSYSTDRSPHEPVRSFTGTHVKNTSVEQKEKVEKERNRLEELEKSLQAASNSIMATTPWQQQQQQQTNKSYSTTERHVTRRVETRKFETQQFQQQQQQQQTQSVSNYDGRVNAELPPLSPPPHPRSASPEWDNFNMHGVVTVNQVITPPPPKQISVVEEDKISLRPIGPGVHTLEPEGMGTIGRSGATTPSFPVSPVASADLLYLDDSTPPFPVSPKTPYYNQAGSASHVTSPFNTMSSTSSQQHHVHHQQQQQVHQPQPQQIQQQQQIQHQIQQQQQHQQQQQQHTQHQQYQYQTSQQQEYHTGMRQQSGSVSSQDTSHALHVDTSPRMLSPGGSMARTPTSPPSPSSLNTLRQQLSVGGTMSPSAHSVTGQSSPSLYFGTSRRGSISSLADSEPAHITTPRFVKDMSKYWYKPHITREDAIVLLKDKHPGSFVVRDSNSYPGAFGLALKVAQIPPNVQTKSTGDPSADLVRHFLIEPTHKGVRLRGSNNEPIFGSLASLVYQHSITPLSLPCKLVLPDAETMAMEGGSTIDSTAKADVPSSAAALLAQGAACNVLFLNSVDTESLTGPQAVARAMKVTFDTQPNPKTTVVHFKVSNQGITLTDNQRKLFFRRHYPVAAVTYCGMDPEGRKWKRETDTGAWIEARVFGFVARKSGGHSDNACHLFAELDPEQPASAIVNFVTKIMIGQSGKVKS